MEFEGHKDVDGEALSRLTGAPRRTWAWVNQNHSVLDCARPIESMGTEMQYCTHCVHEREKHIQEFCRYTTLNAYLLS